MEEIDWWASSPCMTPYEWIFLSRCYAVSMGSCDCVSVMCIDRLESRGNVTRFSSFLIPGVLICREQQHTHLAVLSGLQGAMCQLPKPVVVNWRAWCQHTYTCSTVTPNLKWCPDHRPFNTECVLWELCAVASTVACKGIISPGVFDHPRAMLPLKLGCTGLEEKEDKFCTGFIVCTLLHPVNAFTQNPEKPLSTEDSFFTWNKHKALCHHYFSLWQNMSYNHTFLLQPLKSNWRQLLSWRMSETLICCMT